jgi:hypothetical protein
MDVLSSELCADDLGSLLFGLDSSVGQDIDEVSGRNVILSSKL